MRLKDMFWDKVEHIMKDMFWDKVEHIAELIALLELVSKTFKEMLKASLYSDQ